MHFGMQTTQPKILEFFGHFGIQVSSGQLSNMLIENQEIFHAEKDAIYEAGLRSCHRGLPHTDGIPGRGTAHLRRCTAVQAGHTGCPVSPI